MKAWIHRHLWQRLPRALRRRMLFELAGWLAPLPDVRPAPSGPFYVAGPLRTASGLGASARLCLQALAEAEVEVFGIDISFGDGAKHQDFAFPEAPTGIGPGTIILHINGFLMPLAMLRLGRKRLRGKTVVGYWAWELPELPHEWLPGFRYAHEIWTPSTFVSKAVSAKTALAVRTLPHPLPASAISPLSNAKNQAIVLMAFDMASSFTRKNPLASIAAFRRAFQEDPNWRLLIKVSDADAYPEGKAALEKSIRSAANISLIEALLNPGEMADLLASADIILSLHRSEGFGLLLAEGMLAGKPVVATGWSGNGDFMTPANSCPVLYRLVAAHDPQGTYDHPDLLWADPDIGDAARQLMLLKDPQKRAAIGDRARADAIDLFSRSRYGALVKSYLGIDAGL